MDWSDISTLIGTAAPILGGLVAGPAGSTVASVIASEFGCAPTPDALHAAISTDPEAGVKLAMIQATNKATLQGLVVTSAANQLAADTARIQAVNATLQAEATGKDWLQRNWHPIGGLAAIGLLVAIYFILPLFGQPVPAVPESAWIMLGAILGVTAWQHGQVDQAKIAASSPS